MAKGRATRGWPGPSWWCGGTEVRCAAEGSVQVQEGLHDLDGVLVVDLVRTVLVGTDLVLEAGHRLGTDLAVLLGADPVLQSQHGGLVQLTGLLDVQPVLQGGDGVGAHLAVDLEGAGDGQPAGGLRAGLLGTLLGRLALIGVLGLRCLALLAAVGLVLFRTLLGLALIIGALRLLLLGLFLLLGLLLLGLLLLWLLLLGVLLLLLLLILLGLLLLGLFLLLILALVLGAATFGRAPGVGATGQCHATGGPGARALLGQQHLGRGDLLVLAGQVCALGVLGAADSLPRLLRELQTAVVAVAGVDGPVAARLARSDLVPAARGIRGGAGGQHPGGHQCAAREGCGGAADDAGRSALGACRLVSRHEEGSSRSWGCGHCRGHGTIATVRTCSPVRARGSAQTWGRFDPVNVEVKSSQQPPLPSCDQQDRCRGAGRGAGPGAGAGLLAMVVITH